MAGVCLIAYPGRGGAGNLTRYDVSLLDQLRQQVPIDGFEAHYPTHTTEQTALYLEYAQKHNLLVSSGSDSHRQNTNQLSTERTLADAC
ncbi:MAG: hypothetical protein PVS3B3_08040 [Ktedonobacteraceae bacterium]